MGQGQRIVKNISGNLLHLAEQGAFDVIIHGCNCQCVMGAGIAKSIKELYPQAYAADRATEKGSLHKLGNYSKADTGKFIIVNAYTQFDWRGDGVKVDYNAVRSVFKQIRKEFSGKKIGYPKIGAGLANGNWELIEKIIMEELAGEDHTLVNYTQG
ncbi:MAG: phosphatase [Cellvibrio sp. 79]|nr:MAG: phosphatase [Cellvibrio sp. 79]